MLGWHFHREDSGRNPGADGGVFRNVQRKCGLAHRRASRDNDEFAGLQARCQFVEFSETARNTRDVAAGLMQQIDTIDSVRKNRLERSEPYLATGAFLGDLEHQALSLIDDIRCAAPVGGIGAAADLIAGMNECPKGRVLAQDRCIGFDIGRTGGFIGERRQVFEPAGSLQFIALAQEFGNRHDIAGIAVLGQLVNCGKDQAVVFAVEVVGNDQVRDLLPGLVIEHQTAKQGLLSLYGVRRHLQPVFG